MTNEISIIETEVKQFAKQVSQLSITSTKTLQFASEQREWLKDKIKFLKNHKEVLYRPYKDKIDAINELYKPIEKMLTDAEKSTSSAMSTYQTAIIKKHQEDAAKIAARVGEGKGKIKIDTAINKIESLEKPVELDMTGFLKKQVVVVTNDSLIPRWFLTPDFKAIELALKAGKEVPGCVLEANYQPRSK